MTNPENPIEKLKNIRGSSMNPENPIDKLKNIRFIGGPVGITYLYNKQTNQKIILLADIHEHPTYKCPPTTHSIPIDEYIKLLSDTNLQVTILIESEIPKTPIPTDPKLATIEFNKLFDDNKINDFLNRMIYLGYLHYYSNENTKYTFIDIRDDNQIAQFILAQHRYNTDQIIELLEPKYSMPVNNQHDFDCKVFYFKIIQIAMEPLTDLLLQYCFFMKKKY